MPSLAWIGLGSIGEVRKGMDQRKDLMADYSVGHLQEPRPACAAGGAGDGVESHRGKSRAPGSYV